MATHSSILAWKIPSPRGRKESDTTEQLSLSLSFRRVKIPHATGHGQEIFLKKKNDIMSLAAA